MKQKLLIIGGSTAVGKSKFALELSNFLNIKIISADSIQVYKNLNIGTSKPTEEEKKMCEHYLIDVVDINENFNAFDFVNLARDYISEISKKGYLPVVVGGTGLYIESLLYSYSFKKEKENNESIYDYKLYILNQDREKLYDKINKRVDLMLYNGLLNEVEKLKRYLETTESVEIKEVIEDLRNYIKEKDKQIKDFIYNNQCKKEYHNYDRN